MLVPALDCAGGPPSPTPAVIDSDEELGDSCCATICRPWDGVQDPLNRSPRSRKMLQQCTKELRVMVTRIPEKRRQRRNDILGRVLRNRDTEEDCIRAETSRIMDDEEVRQQKEKRRTELAFTCGGPLTVHHPDVTSTPRPDCGGLGDRQSQGAEHNVRDIAQTQHNMQLRRPRPTRYTVAADWHIDDEEELRSGADQHFARDWNVSGEYEDAPRDDPMTAVGPADNNNNGGLNLDAAGINALATSLRESINQSHDTNHAEDIADPARERSSTPTDPNWNAPPEMDEPMDQSAVSTGSRKRGRGGKKHRKSGGSSVSSTDGQGGKLARPSPQPTTSEIDKSLSPRGRGRPPGSLNKRYSKERASTRQMRLINSNVGEQQQLLREQRATTHDRSKQSEPRSSASSMASGSSATDADNEQGPGPAEPMDVRHAGPPPQQSDSPTNAPASMVTSGGHHDPEQGPGSNLQRALVPFDQQQLQLAPWSTQEIAAISELIGQRCAGGGAEYLANDEPGLDPVDMDYMPSTLNQSLSVDLDESRVFDMRELVSPDIDIRSGSQVRTRDVVQFVLLARPRRDSDRRPTSSTVATDWFVPDTADFHDLINRAESTMIEQNLQCFKARKWSNFWGKVGLLGLSPKNTQHLHQYRSAVEASPTRDLTFTLFPREAVENRGSISLVLRDQFRSLSAKCVPASLFSLNRGLRGNLRVTHSKAYSSNDKTRTGISKAGWRLLLLQGCPEFMRSLEQYDEDERFSLGSGYVYIRGGVRKPKSSNTTRNRQGRPRTEHEQRQPQEQQRRSNDHNNSRRDDFPRLNDQQERRGGNTGSTGGNTPWGGQSAGRDRRPGPSSTSWGGQ